MFDLVLFGLLLLSSLLVHLHRRRFVLAVGENKVRHANLHLNNPLSLVLSNASSNIYLVMIRTYYLLHMY